MRWLRSHRNGAGWLACFALACQLVLSFGHIHLTQPVGQASTAAALGSALAGDASGGDNPGQPKHPSGLTDDYCAVCRNISLTAASIVPIAPAIEVPHSIVAPLSWSATEAEPPGLAYLLLRARGPPQA
jgi:hypothetical protein